MRPPEGFEWLLILFIVLLLFGSKKLPEMARSLGRSARILKAETRGLTEDDAPAVDLGPDGNVTEPVVHPVEKPAQPTT